MADYCDHGYAPQRSGDGDGTNGSCGVCEDIAELKAELSRAQAEIAGLRAVVEAASVFIVEPLMMGHATENERRLIAAFRELKETEKT